MEIEIDVPRKMKVLAVSSAVMLLNERHPNHVFGHNEIEIDKPKITMNQRGKRDFLLAKALDIPIDEIFRLIMEETHTNDPQDAKLLAGIISTLYHCVEQEFALEHVEMEAPPEVKADKLAGIGQLDLKEFSKSGT